MSGLSGWIATKRFLLVFFWAIFVLLIRRMWYYGCLLLCDREDAISVLLLLAVMVVLVLVMMMVTMLACSAGTGWDGLELDFKWRGCLGEQSFGMRISGDRISDDGGIYSSGELWREDLVTLSSLILHDINHDPGMASRRLNFTFANALRRDNIIKWFDFNIRSYLTNIKAEALQCCKS